MTTIFKQLANDIKQCQLCLPHLPMGANPVFQATPQAKILIAGQAPGIRVHQSSIPFNDPSGDRLRQWMGVSRDTFYDANKVAIIPMAFCYPGTGKQGDLPPRKECAQAWHHQLLPLLPKLELKLIIGKYAQDYYLGQQMKKNLTLTVKNWESYCPEIIPLPHPSPRNNIWLKKNPWFEQEVIPCLQQRIANMLY